MVVMWMKASKITTGKKKEVEKVILKAEQKVGNDLKKFEVTKNNQLDLLNDRGNKIKKTPLKEPFGLEFKMKKIGELVRSFSFLSGEYLQPKGSERHANKSLIRLLKRAGADDDSIFYYSGSYACYPKEKLTNEFLAKGKNHWAILKYKEDIAILKEMPVLIESPRKGERHHNRDEYPEERGVYVIQFDGVVKRWSTKKLADFVERNASYVLASY